MNLRETKDGRYIGDIKDVLCTDNSSGQQFMILDTAGNKGVISNVLKLPNGAKGANIRAGLGIDAM